ncbi:hypothetical protein [Parvularcula marina]|uniref:hypothetical protein n=1 Tax=Parvularcula marina TaxID=2292771 RepID=UPI003514DB63
MRILPALAALLSLIGFASAQSPDDSRHTDIDFDTDEFLIAAEQSPVFLASYTTTSLGRTKLEPVDLGDGIEFDFGTYLTTSRLSTHPVFDDLMTNAMVSQGLIAASAAYREKIYDMEDAYIVDRELSFTLLDKACDGKKDDANATKRFLRELCFNSTDVEADFKEGSALNQLRTRMEAAEKLNPSEKFRDGHTLRGLSAKSDSDFYRFLVDTDRYRALRVTSIVRKSKLSAASFTTGGNVAGSADTVVTEETELPPLPRDRRRPGDPISLSTPAHKIEGVELPPVSTTEAADAATGQNIDIGPTRMVKELIPGDIAYEDIFFLTGSHTGRDVFERIELTFARETAYTKRFFIRTQSSIRYGLAFRMPLQVNATSRPAPSSDGRIPLERQMTVLAAGALPGGADGITADELYGAAGIPAGYRTSDQYIYSSVISCTVHASIPTRKRDGSCVPPNDKDLRSLPTQSESEIDLGRTTFAELDGAPGIAESLTSSGVSAKISLGMNGHVSIPGTGSLSFRDDETSRLYSLDEDGTPVPDSDPTSAPYKFRTGTGPAQLRLSPKGSSPQAQAENAVFMNLTLAEPRYDLSFNASPKSAVQLHLALDVLEMNVRLGPFTIDSLATPTGTRLDHVDGTVRAYDFVARPQPEDTELLPRSRANLVIADDDWFSYPKFGGNGRVELAIANAGKIEAAAPGRTDRPRAYTLAKVDLIRLSDESHQSTNQYSYAEDIPPGASMNAGFSLKIPATTGKGLYRVCVTLDPDNQIPESNETDNKACTDRYLFGSADEKCAAFNPNNLAIEKNGDEYQLVSTVSGLPFVIAKLGTSRPEAEQALRVFKAEEFTEKCFVGERSLAAPFQYYMSEGRIPSTAHSDTKCSAIPFEDMKVRWQAPRKTGEAWSKGRWIIEANGTGWYGFNNRYRAEEILARIKHYRINRHCDAGGLTYWLSEPAAN